MQYSMRAVLHSTKENLKEHGKLSVFVRKKGPVAVSVYVHTFLKETSADAGTQRKQVREHAV